MAKGKLSIHTENIFPIIKKWLYSEHDIFLREIIANAIDALSKREAMDKKVGKKELKVKIEIDKDNKCIKVIDTGIGMTADEIKRYINQIAFSGAEDFVEKYKNKDIIGHFGLGFYSSFMVSDKVTIDSLSYQEGAEAAAWECEGETEYKMIKGSRTTVGTTVSIYLNNDSKDYIESYKIKDILDKYCTFMPYPIEFEDKVINQKEPLWEKDPKEVKEKEYKEFYKEYFHDWQEPLFWIHLNIDYPFNLKGILYFPKLDIHAMRNTGMVKLFCNRVFVADNVKELLPEFLLLLKGGIDIPDIPLNVSRSFLQHDKEVQKITGYIIKKIGDELKRLFNDDRKKYEKIWEDIQKYVKYGVLTQEKFFENCKEIILFQTTDKKWLSLSELIAEQTEEKKKVHYTTDANSPYIEILTKEGNKVVLADELLDNHLYQKYEMADNNLSFTRVDAQVAESMVDKDTVEEIDDKGKGASDKLKELFEKQLDDKKITVKVQALKMKDIPAMIVFDEQMRRFMEMNSMMNQEEDKMSITGYELVINSNNELIKKLGNMNAKTDKDKISLLCRYINDLALIKQNNYSPKKLQEFVKMSSEILEMIN